MDRKAFGLCAAAATASLGALLSAGCGNDSTGPATITRKESTGATQPSVVVVRPHRDFFADEPSAGVAEEPEQATVAPATESVISGNALETSNTAESQPADPWSTDRTAEPPMASEAPGWVQTESVEPTAPATSEPVADVSGVAQSEQLESVTGESAGEVDPAAPLASSSESVVKLSLTPSSVVEAPSDAQNTITLDITPQGNSKIGQQVGETVDSEQRELRPLLVTPRTQPGAKIAPETVATKPADAPAKSAVNAAQNSNHRHDAAPKAAMLAPTPAPIEAVTEPQPTLAKQPPQTAAIAKSSAPQAADSQPSPAVKKVPTPAVIPVPQIVDAVEPETLEPKSARPQKLDELQPVATKSPAADAISEPMTSTVRIAAVPEPVQALPSPTTEQSQVVATPPPAAKPAAAPVAAAEQPKSRPAPSAVAAAPAQQQTQSPVESDSVPTATPAISPTPVAVAPEPVAPAPVAAAPIAAPPVALAPVASAPSAVEVPQPAPQVAAAPQPKPAPQMAPPAAEPLAAVPQPPAPIASVAAAPVSSVRSPTMIATLSRADERVRHAIQLAEKGAMYASRKEFTSALTLIAQARDVEHGTRQYSQATAAGFQAIKEAGDFVKPGSQDANLTRLVAGHKTPVLKQVDVSDMPPTIAAQYYYNFAKDQLATGIGRETVGSIALYGLGKLIIAGGGASSQQLEYTGPAMALYQAALICEPQNFRAAHELGVLLAGSGQLEMARELLMGSIGTSTQPTMWKNLAVVHSRLGEQELATQANQKAEVLKQTAPDPRTPAVQWVDPATFANLGANGEAAPQTAPAAEPAKPEPPKAPANVARKRTEWNPLNLRR